mgnify:CR=1 FL=1|jgi:hypothetical protein
MDPQSITNILGMGASYAPLASNLAPQFSSSMSGLPLPGGPETRLMFEMALGSQFNSIMSKAGMAGIGVGHGQNMYDRLQSQEFYRRLQESQADAAKQDRSSFMGTMRGMALLTGQPFTPEMKTAAGHISDLAVSASPFLAPMFGDVIDQLHGRRGSAMIMQQRMASAGRYRLDPTTGQMGMSNQSLKRLNENIMEDFYSDEKIGQMKGISAGQLGSLYSELSTRGMIAGSAFRPSISAADLTKNMSADDAVALARRAGVQNIRKGKNGQVDLSGMGSDDLSKLTQAATQDAGFMEKLDTNKVKRSLKSHLEAITAMRDIFGDAGKPNAPIPELMRALDAMSMGSMGQVDAGRLAKTVRQTYYLAKSAGISADTAMLIQQDAAVHGRQLGIESPFAMTATQHALAFNATLRSSGAFATPVFGGMTEAQMTQFGRKLTTQGIASNLGTRFGTLARMRDAMDGKVAGTDLGGVLEAIQNNETFATIGGRKVDLTKLTNQQVEQIGVNAGLSKSTIANMLTQKPQAREALDRNPELAAYVRETAQPAEVGRTLTRSAVASLGAGLRPYGISGTQLSGLATNVVAKMRELTPDDYNQMPDFEKNMARIIEEQLPANVRNALPKNPEQRQAALRMLATSVIGNMDKTTMKGMNAKLQNVLTTTDPRVLAETRSRQQYEKIQDVARSTMSGVTGDSMLRSIVDAVKNTKEGDPDAGMKIIGAALGGIDIATIREKLGAPVEEMGKVQQEIEDLAKKQMKFKPNTKEYKDLQKEIDVKQTALKGAVDKLQKGAAAVGAVSTTGITNADMDAATEASKRSSTLSVTMGGMFGVNQNITADEIEKYKTDITANVKKQASAVLMDPKATPEQKATATKQIDDIAAGKFKVSDAAARKGISDERARMVKEPITEAEIDALLKTDAAKGSTRKEASDFLMMQKRAAALGITEADIEEHLGHRRAIDVVPDTLASKQESMIALMTYNEFRVSDAEINKEMTKNNVRDPEQARTNILKQRQKEKSEKFDEFRKTDAGAHMKKLEDEDKANLRNMIDKLREPLAVLKMGKGALDTAAELEGIQQKMTNLAADFSGGDMAKFRAGIFTEDVISDPKKSQAAVEAQQEMANLNKQRDAVLKGMRGANVGKDAKEIRMKTAALKAAGVDVKGTTLEEINKQIAGLDAGAKNKFQTEYADTEKLEKFDEKDVALIKETGNDKLSKEQKIKLDKSIEARAKVLGMDPAELRRLYDKRRPELEKAAEAEKLQGLKNSEVADRFKGLAMPELSADGRKKLDELLGGENGANVKQELIGFIGAKERLQTVGKDKKKNLDEIQKAYDEGMKKGDMADFTKEFGVRAIDDIKTMNRVVKKGAKEEDFLKSLEQAKQRPDAKAADPKKELVVKGELSGKFEIVGNQLQGKNLQINNGRGAMDA